MRKRNRRPLCRKIVLNLPDLDHAKSAVLNSLSSPHSRRNYKFAMEQFIAWYCSEPRLSLNRAVVLRFRLHLESLGFAAGTVILGLILFDGLRPAFLGLILGLAASAGATQLIRSMLYGTEPSDPAVISAVILTLLFIALIACIVPAWRASRLDPMQALRTE